MGVIEFPSALPNYAGRTLALNMEKARRFQCHNFFLGIRVPYAVVPSEAEAGFRIIHQAILDGRLLDVTDANIKGLKTTSFELDPVKEDDTGGKMMFFVSKKFKSGETAMIMVTPRDAEQSKDFQRQLKETGSIILDDFDEKELESPPPGLSTVTVTELPEESKPKLIVLAGTE